MKRKAIICDIDGTIADMIDGTIADMIDGTIADMIDGTIADMGKDDPKRRGPYDWDRVGEDTPIHPVITLIHMMFAVGFSVIFVSGRTEQARSATVKWIDRHVGFSHPHLIMRPDGDFRSDAEVKEEIFYREIEPLYQVAYVLDDRNKVVAMWRSLGLTVLQVADGDF